VFLLVALLAALFVCLKAANVTSLRTEPTYRSMPPSIISAA
jgi:phospholipid/cholesterol/gamma-HCH transport system substrate-binding protein